jgi:pimeloyl-ACP methyl ester carboxylesterase
VIPRLAPTPAFVAASSGPAHHAGMAESVSPQTAVTAVLADGRRISWAQYGRSDGTPLVMLHGTPGSRLQFQWMHEHATAAGIRVIAPERPGYGASDPAPAGITCAAYADDLRQLLDRLGLPLVTLCGVSGGGGFALAAAIRLPERFERLILVSAGVPVPRAARRGQALPVRLLLSLARYAPSLTGRLLAAQLSADPNSAMTRAGTRFMPTSDRRVFEAPEWRRQFDEDFRVALEQGPGAAVQDLALATRPLGVDVADLTVETVLLHGTEDVNVPVSIARWLAAHVPSARLIEQRGAGHLFSLEQPQLIFEWVGRS